MLEANITSLHLTHPLDSPLHQHKTARNVWGATVVHEGGRSQQNTNSSATGPTDLTQTNTQLYLLLCLRSSAAAADTLPLHKSKPTTAAALPLRKSAVECPTNAGKSG
jgi:hypothetical protein